MARAVTALGALLGLASHVLIAAAIATNFWLFFRDRPPPAAPPAAAPRSPRSPALNPLLNDSGLGGDLVVRYRADHLGVWVACFMEIDYGNQVSCGFIDSACTSRVCWKVNDTKRTCSRAPVAALAGKCAAFQATRVMAVVGTFFSIVGTTFLFVSLYVMVRLFALAGAFCTLLGALSLMVSFAVFLGAVVTAGAIHPVARTGYSFILLIASWVVAFFAALLACIGAATAHPKDDAMDYSE